LGLRFAARRRSELATTLYPLLLKPHGDDPPQPCAAPRSFRFRRRAAGTARGGLAARSRRSARVVLDELVEGFRLRVRVLQHPEEVLEEDHLAADDGAAGLSGAAGAVDEALEQRVAYELLGDEVPAARLADVDRVQALGHLVGAVERRARPALAGVGGRRRAGDAA
jgi:hypothetical protein